jgi:hypothetical protein
MSNGRLLHPSRKRTATSFLYLVFFAVPAIFVSGLFIVRFQKLTFSGSFTKTTTFVKEGKTGEPSIGQASDICSRFVPSTTAAITTPSTSSVWKELKHQILNASYLPLENAPNLAFRGWIDKLFHFHAAERLRRSISNPASTSAVRHILKKLSDYPTTKEPLRVLVLGGSVTSGHGCNHNPLDIPGGPKGNKPFQDCAWPARLEYLLNHVFFGGERVFQFFNLAVGGSSSDIGAMLLEYQLLPKGMGMPHIVLLAYSANDSQQDDTNVLFYQHMQDLVQAAHNLRRCDTDLPLVVMVDDFYGIQPNRIMEHTGRVYSISSWYKTMSVNYANVVRHAVYANYVNASAPDPLMGNKYGTHFGMGFHIGMAWTVLFNFLNAAVEACSDGDDGLESSLALSTTKWITSWADNASSEELSSTAKQGTPSKYMARLQPKSTPASIVSEWKDRVAVEEKNCQTNERINTTSHVPVCSYAWMVNRQTEISRPVHIDNVLRTVLTSNDGWVAKGKPIQQPRTGWYAQKENATFSLKIHNVSVETNFLTFLTMKSYGPTWFGIKLVVVVRVAHVGNDNNRNPNNITNSHGEEASYEISGYHETKTSVHFPHKLQLPGGGAKVGDTIIVEAQLASGSNFKIAGMAFCTF